jgi:riboflavin synthase
MFTGIIEELGTVASIEKAAAGSRIAVNAQLVTSDLTNGDSIAVSGVCLTAADVSADSFSADVSPETLERTTLGSLAISTLQ